MENKITKRDMFVAIRTLAEAGSIHIADVCENITDDMIIEFCDNEVELLDKKASKAKERAATKKAEGDELTETVYQAMTEEFEPIADITARINDENVSVAKVQYRLRKLAEAGKVEKTELTIPATEGGKARKIVGYRKV